MTIIDSINIIVIIDIFDIFDIIDIIGIIDKLLARRRRHRLEFGLYLMNHIIYEFCGRQIRNEPN